MIIIEIPGHPPKALRANERMRTHWSERRRVADEWIMGTVRPAMVPCWHLIPRDPWASVHAETLFIFENRRRRDLGNYFDGLKELFDWLSTGTNRRPGIGIYHDDNWLAMSHSFMGALGKQAYTVIILTEGRKVLTDSGSKLAISIAS